MAQVIDGLLWTERYRPTSLDDVVLSDEHRALLEGYIAAGEIPHLLISGPPGTGKTTVAMILNAKLDAKVLTLNASNERGIDVIRERVINFARGKMRARWNHIFFDEADALTPDAQNALRNTMETYAGVARFIMTCNNVHKIIAPLRSRCVEIVLAQTTFQQRFKLLSSVLASEKIGAEPQVILGYAERYSDLRQLLMRAQKSVVANSGVLGPADQVDVSGRDLIQFVLAKDYGSLRNAASAAGFDGGQALRAMFLAVQDNFGQAARFRFTLARALTDTATAPDPVITFLGCCAELITFV